MSLNVSVLGLSGPESERGPEGIGKSCLCNRLIRPVADDFYEHHVWLLSSSDFNSRVVNSDQFLFWGTTSTVVGNTPCSVNIIEQTEFIHDETLRPFTSLPYSKRALFLRLRSRDKIAYFSKAQLGFENEYPIIPMPHELIIDGFILCYDVSTSHKYFQDIQDHLICKLAQDLHKMSKPFVVAVMKMDVADPESLAHFYEVIGGNRYLKNAAIVETSSKLNVNVENLLIFVASAILKHSSVKHRIVRFAEGHAKWSLETKQISDKYHDFLQQSVSSWSITWAFFEPTLVRNTIYRAYVDRFGTKNARSCFEMHITQLCKENASIVKRQWFCDLPTVFLNLLSESDQTDQYLDSDLILDDQKYQTIYSQLFTTLRHNSNFEKYFQPNCLYAALSDFSDAKGASLLEMSKTDKRIPLDILESTQALEVFKITLRSLKRRKLVGRLRNELKNQLERDANYAPGMKSDESLSFVRANYSGRYDDLDEDEQRTVFEELYNILVDRAVIDLRNLIEQSCADIMFDSTTFPDVAVDKAERLLSQRSRYRRLDRLSPLRTQVVRDWLSAVWTGDCRSCPSGQVRQCMANRLRQSLSLRPHTPPRRFGILLIGAKRDAISIENSSKTLWPDNIMKLESPRSSPHSFRLDFVRLNQASPGEQPRSVQRADAMIFLVSSEASAQSAKESLQNIASASIASPRIICLLSSATDADELPQTREDLFMNVKQLGESMSAELVDCRFPNTSSIGQAIKRLASFSLQHVSTACANRDVDVRLAFFCRCSDPYSTDLITGPMLRGPCFHLDVDDQLPPCASIVRQHLFLDSFRKTVQILFVPYHARACATVFHSVEKVHGVILVFDPNSQQSYATMAAEANRRVGIPIFLLAVDESKAPDTAYTNEPSCAILNDAAELAENLSAHFVKTDSKFSNQSAVYTPFIRAAFERRGKTEQLWALYQQKKRTHLPPSSNLNMAVNSLGRIRGSASVTNSSSLNHLGLVLPSNTTTATTTQSRNGKEKPPKKSSPEPQSRQYQSSLDSWPITEHGIDVGTGSSLPILQLIKAIESLDGPSALGIYRISGKSMDSQNLLQQLRSSRVSNSEMTSQYDVHTLATTLKAVIKKSNIISDELSYSLVDTFANDKLALSNDNNSDNSSSGRTAVILSLLSIRLPFSPHRQTLCQLFSHLAKVAQKQPDTMNAPNLARIFWPSLLSSLIDNVTLDQVTRLQNMAESLLVFFIENWQDLFIP